MGVGIKFFYKIKLLHFKIKTRSPPHNQKSPQVSDDLKNN